MFRILKGTAKVGVAAGMTYVAGAELNNRYHTENPSPQFKASADAVKSAVEKEGYHSKAFTNYCQIGDSVHAFHHQAEKSKGLVGSLTGTTSPTISVRQVSLFNKVSIQTVRDNREFSMTIRAGQGVKG